MVRGGSRHIFLIYIKKNFSFSHSPLIGFFQIGAFLAQDCESRKAQILILYFSSSSSSSSRLFDMAWAERAGWIDRCSSLRRPWLYLFLPSSLSVFWFGWNYDPMARSVAIKHEKRISTFLLLLLPVIEEIAWKHLVPAASPLEVAREKERESGTWASPLAHLILTTKTAFWTRRK